MKKHSNIICLFVPLVFSIIVLFGWSCTNQKDVNKIGAIFSMTGDVGAYGQRTYRGFMLALDEINKDGGIQGKKVVAVVEDAKSSSKDAVAAFQKLVTVNKVHIIVGRSRSAAIKNGNEQMILVKML